MRKILSVFFAAILICVFSVSPIAAATSGDALLGLVRYYDNNIDSEKNILETLSLAYLYRPMPEKYYESTAESHKLTKAEIEATEDPAFTAAELIIFAAATNIKLTDLAVDFTPYEIIIASKRENGFYSDTLYKSAVCLAALFAVDAEIDEEAATKAFTDRRIADGAGWAENGEAAVDYELTFFILSVLSRNKDGIAGDAYLSVRERFLTLINENGEVMINGEYRPDIAAMAIACANDYGVDNITGEFWKGILNPLLARQHEDGYFTDSEGKIDEKLTVVALHALTSEYKGQSGVGKLVEGRGFIIPDFTDITKVAVGITVAAVVVIFVVVFLFHAMHKGKKERLSHNAENDGIA